jgi:hypothetical protein
MGAREALAALAVHLVPPGPSTRGTAETLTPSCSSPSSPGSPAARREPNAQQRGYRCTRCERPSLYARATVCFCVRTGMQAEDDAADPQARLARCIWAGKLRYDLHRWLSFHPVAFWETMSHGAIARIEAQQHLFDLLLDDYVESGEPGDRKAAVFASNAVAQVAAEAARSWSAAARITN